MTVKEYLEQNAVGLVNRKSREEISRACGMPDRAARLEIASLRQSGVAIVSTSKHSGYWIYPDNCTAEEFDEADLMVKETYARRSELLTMIIPVENKIYPEGQIPLFT
jgi:hypothetical protein